MDQAVDRDAPGICTRFQDIFGYGGNIPIDELLPVGQDAVIELLGAARRTWAEMVRSTYKVEAQRIAALVCGALVPSSAWSVKKPTTDGIRFVGHLLETTGLGESDTWAWMLTQALSSRGGAATRRLAEHATACGQGDRTAVVRVLLRAAWSHDELPGPTAGATPLEMLMGVQAVVRFSLPLDPEADVPARELVAVEELLSSIEEQLVRQLAAAVGALYAEEVEEFFARIPRS